MAKKTTKFGRLTRLGLLAVLVIGTLAFDVRQADTIEDPADTIDNLVAAVAMEDPADTIDNLFAAVAMQVPEFGGMSVDAEQDILYVYLRGGGSETVAAVIAALRAVFSDKYLPQGRVQVLPAKFGFLELKQWHDRLAMQVLGLPGVTLTDIDESNNRLLIGVENSRAWDLVEKRLAALRIPREAVDFIETGPIEFDTSLNDRHRPLVGGLEIGFQRGVSSFVCTLGFNAIRAGVLGFVTNSHCSASRGVVEGTIYYQPDIVPSDQVGIETVDPGFRGCFCIRFIGCLFRCRQSDSNFSRLAGPMIPGSALGFIARPAPNSLAWDGVSTFRIVAEAPSLFTGVPVAKVGRTTGRTHGAVVLTGVTVPIGGRRLLRNQVLASYVRAGGDSGSPVIVALPFDLPGNPIDTDLAGIHWGGFNVPVAGVPIAVYSPIRGVEADLGPLTVVAPPPPMIIP